MSINNNISANISYLVKKTRFSQSDFGNLFNLKQTVVNQYINGKSFPKIETIQKICNYFEISIDDFINTDLSEKPYAIRDGKLLMSNEPDKEDYSPISPRYVDQLEKSLNDKERIILALENSLLDKEKLIQTLEKKKTQNSA